MALLRDLDQPFVSELRSRRGRAEYRLAFCDTASPASWRLLRPDLVVLCYDISRRCSLDNLQTIVRGPPLPLLTALSSCSLVAGNETEPRVTNRQEPQWAKEVRTTFEDSDVLPLLVLGLKRDLRSDDDSKGTVHTQEAVRVAQEMRVDKYAECSAVTGELLQLAFEDVCQMAVQTATAGGAQSEGSCAVM